MRNLLAMLGNNMSVVTPLLLSFAEDSKGRPDQIQAKIAAGDLDSAMKLAHKTRGASGQIGCMRLHAAAGALESELEAKRINAAVVDEFCQAFDQVMTTIARLS